MTVRERPSTALLTDAIAALIALVMMAAVTSCSNDTPAPTANPDAANRPNFVVIMTDDQTVTDLQFMAKTTKLLGSSGTTFANNFVSFPLCCPSRASFLTGQYAHNNGVENNVPPTRPGDPPGGNDALDHKHTLPVWMQAAGYNTAHVGKYLNGYGETSPPSVPPGYTDWFGLIDPSTLNFWDYNVLDNARTAHYGTGDGDYQTDVLADRAVADIKKFAADTKPFYLTVWPLAPHSAESKSKGVPIFTTATKSMPDPLAPVPAPRHRDTFKDLTYPHGPSFMEADLSDKPPSVQKVKQQIFDGLKQIGLTADDLDALIDLTYRARAESLLAVDDLVERVVNALSDSGKLQNTIVVFTSDNGWLLGEHGIPFAKVVLYEEAARVPLIVRGPGFPAGKTVTQIVENVDLAPTIAALAGAKPDLEVDGRDVTSFVKAPDEGKNRAILLEEFSHKPTYQAVRAPGFMYAEYDDGSAELYDLLKDPHQLESKAADPAYAKARDRLAKALHELKACKATSCQVAVPQSELR